VNVKRLPPAPDAVPFAPFDPAPGVYAIGATTLQGVYAPDVNTFAWFRSREPDAILGYALFLYRVSQHPAPDWAAICFGLPSSERQIRLGFGRPDLRLVFYDCTQSQVYPVGQEGRYLRPPRADWPEEEELVLQARQPDGEPAFVVLRSGERPVVHGEKDAVVIEGPLNFLGYKLAETNVHRSQEIVLTAFWLVEQVPNRPLSLMAHLVGRDGIPIAVGDGLGVPVEGWQVGDVIAQQHQFLVPDDVIPGEYWFQTGGYWLDTLERWPVHQDDGTINDRLLLDKITVLD
jgi:hypothetical protein